MGRDWVAAFLMNGPRSEDRVVFKAAGFLRLWPDTSLCALAFGPSQGDESLRKKRDSADHLSSESYVAAVSLYGPLTASQRLWKLCRRHCERSWKDEYLKQLKSFFQSRGAFILKPQMGDKTLWSSCSYSPASVVRAVMYYFESDCYLIALDAMKSIPPFCSVLHTKMKARVWAQTLTHTCRGHFNSNILPVRAFFFLLGYLIWRIQFNSIKGRTPADLEGWRGLKEAGNKKSRSTEFRNENYA